MADHREHRYGDETDCICGRNFATVRGLREHLTKQWAAEAQPAAAINPSPREVLGSVRHPLAPEPGGSGV